MNIFIQLNKTYVTRKNSWVCKCLFKVDRFLSKCNIKENNWGIKSAILNKINQKIYISKLIAGVYKLQLEGLKVEVFLA